MTQSLSTPQQILDYWFGALQDPGYGQPHMWWFQKNEARDQDIRDRFMETYVAAREGHCDHWMQTPEGSLALILVLDQFPRNMFRDSPRAFEADPLALNYAKTSVDQGVNQKLPEFMRAFVYLPFEHSEDLRDQNRSVDLFRRLGNDVYLDYALQHQVIIERFGRFPHRNTCLGRQSTPQEEAFLQEPGSSF